MKPSQRKPVFATIPGRPDLQRFIGFEGDPGTNIPRQVTRPQASGLNGIYNRKYRGLGGSNASEQGGRVPPLTNGAPGNPVFPYNEQGMWGTNDPDDVVSAPIDPSVAMPPDIGPTIVDPGLSIPFGISIVPWRNPTTFQSVPILATTPINTPVLSLNMQRNGLLIQNNSTATAPDVPATFWIGFNAQPQVGLSLSLAPGAGLLFDIITPRDAVYVLSAGFSGASNVIQGVVVQGTYAPI